MRRHLQSQLELSQEGPVLGNQFNEDSALKDYLSFYINLLKLSAATEIEVYKNLTQLGEKVVKAAEFAANAEKNPPKLINYDSLGKRIGVIETSEGWKQLREFALQQGIIHDNYTGRFGVASRFVQMVQLYIFQASSGMWGCPMAMTDGAAFVLKSVLQSNHPYEATILDTYKRLISNDKNEAFTSGQWMTEKLGGSDVSQSTQTIAITTADDYIFKLFGYKWFSSGTESEVAITLGRVSDPLTGKTDTGLTAFLVRLHEGGKKLKKEIEIVRLKEKLGTKPVPTAELLLRGVEGIRVSERGKGVKFISGMLNITRLYNASTAVSYSRRVHVMAKDYSTK